MLTAFDAESFIDPARLRRVDQFGRLSLSACRLALDDARLTGVKASVRDQVGVVLGSYTAGVRSTVEYLENLTAHGPAGASAMSFSNTVGNAAASLCGIEYGLRGPNVTLSNKEASALAAIALAFRLVRQLRAAAVVTGGADEIEPMFYSVHDRFRVLSPTDGGEEASRPFDIRRNGFVFGEGGYLLVLEPMTSADTRGAGWYGEVLGVGATASVCRLNDWPADSLQLARCMRMALDSAGVPAGNVDVVFASANSTPQLDRLEASALSDVFGRGGVRVVSIKGAVGEFGAAGAASTAAALLCLREGVIPPTVGCDELDAELGVDVSSAARALPAGANGRIAMINGFASGGTNYSLVLRGNPS
jgi:3-oxoacyl-[acyl-carrier-protein] synthase II